ncbi:MAG: MFS transporter [Actinomycetes bacterium]
MIAPRLRALAERPAFRTLLRVRLVGQFSDGLLQAGLIGVVLFAPERAASPGRIALGFAVLLLPFCLVAPLAGVVLDRWSRVRVLALANVTRALLLAVTALAAATTSAEAVVFGCALVAIGINRLVLAALGASLPRTVSADLLISGNALAPTLGTAATVIGAASGLALRGWLDPFATAAPFVAAAIGYVAAALATRSFTTHQLGPVARLQDLPNQVPSVFQAAWADVRSGALHIAQSRQARRALVVMGGNRVLFGCFTVWTVLLIRFHLSATKADENHALAALGAVALSLGLGLIGAALWAPPLLRRHGPRRAAAVALAVAAVGTALPLLSLRPGALFLAWVFIGAGAQILKITVDTVLQRALGDDVRGRVFIAYDIVFNVAFVVGVVAVATLPSEVVASATVAVAVAAGYGIGAAATWRRPRG